MRQRWRKLGLVYAPDRSQSWARSHAMIPTPLELGDGRLRIYYASVTDQIVGSIGYLEVDLMQPTRVLYNTPEPVLGPGEPGCFDDNGVNPICAVRDGNLVRLYYVGYQLGVQVRYFLFSGLALSEDGGRTFRRHSRAPVLDRSDSETLVRTAPFVAREGMRWRMWYVGGDRFVLAGDRLRPTYTLRYLESNDGLAWSDQGREVIPLQPGEFGLGRPYIVQDSQHYRMWYSVRTASQGYRLGYAESADGITWQRLDECVGIDVSPAGWDSEMICYCCVVPTPGGMVMYYNGNDYGRTGFGAAILE